MLPPAMMKTYSNAQLFPVAHTFLCFLIVLVKWDLCLVSQTQGTILNPERADSTLKK